MTKPTFTVSYKPGWTVQQGVWLEQAVQEALDLGYQAGLRGDTEVPAATLNVEATLDAAQVIRMRQRIVDVSREAYAAGWQDRETE